MTLTERNLGNLRDPIVPEGGELKWPQLPLSWGFYVSPDIQQFDCFVVEKGRIFA
jgi:hypothetical protein